MATAEDKSPSLDELIERTKGNIERLEKAQKLKRPVWEETAPIHLQKEVKRASFWNVVLAGMLLGGAWRYFDDMRDYQARITELEEQLDATQTSTRPPPVFAEQQEAQSAAAGDKPSGWFGSLFGRSLSSQQDSQSDSAPSGSAGTEGSSQKVKKSTTLV